LQLIELEDRMTSS